MPIKSLKIKARKNLNKLVANIFEIQNPFTSLKYKCEIINFGHIANSLEDMLVVIKIPLGTQKKFLPTMVYGGIPARQTRSFGVGLIAQIFKKFNLCYFFYKKKIKFHTKNN